MNFQQKDDPRGWLKHIIAINSEDNDLDLQIKRKR